MATPGLGPEDPPGDVRRHRPDMIGRFGAAMRGRFAGRMRRMGVEPQQVPP